MSPKPLQFKSNKYGAQHGVFRGGSFAFENGGDAATGLTAQRGHRDK